MSNIKKFDQQVWINDKMSIGDDYQQEPRVTIDMSGKTDAIFVPVGDNSERPINTGNTLNQIDTLSGNGFLRYNKETQKFEGYEDLQWKNFITSNANMQFIPNYYVIDETELDAAYSDINTNYNGGNIYIADEVILTSNKTWDLQGIKLQSQMVDLLLQIFISMVVMVIQIIILIILILEHYLILVLMVLIYQIHQ